MDEPVDVDIKHERSNPYGPPPPIPIHRLPPAETSSLHSYPPPPSAAMPPPTPAWAPAPSPYPESTEHRPPPPDVAHHSPYPPPPQSYPPSHHHHPPPPPLPSAALHPPPGREPPGYPPDSAYGRPGSVSAPSRSPAEVQHSPYHPVSSNPHEPPYYPPPPADYRARHAYPGPESQPNGTHQPPPLHVVTGHEMMPGQPPGGPQPPPPPPPYGPPSAGPPSSAGSYYYDPYNAAAQRRKPVRAAQACDSCRQRKAKCDEGRPECQHCKDNGLKCSYREVPPQKAEKQVLAITSQLEALSDDIKLLAQSFKEFKDQQEKINLSLLPSVGSKPEPSAATEMSPPANEHKVSIIRPQETPNPSQTTPFVFRREDSSEAGRSASRTQNASAAFLQDPKDSEAMEFSLPVKHTTAAQNLILWPNIRFLIPPGLLPTYVMDEELGRGLLRLYGCGEGEDKGDGHEGAPSPGSSSTSSDGRRADDDASSSGHGVWGTGQLHAPLLNPGHTAREHPGGVSPSGGLMLDSAAVDRYFRTFMDNMHILHPFLEPKVLRRMVHTFKRKYSWDFQATHRVTSVGIKRKREATDSPLPMDDHNSSSQHTRPGSSGVPPIEHSVTNAIVLLVMALGKVISHRAPLPGPAAPVTRHTSTPHRSLYSDLPLPMSAPTSPENNTPNANGMISSPANPQGKNMDVMPGLAYFAKAADILGELPGGSDVSHIQANLLAGLYMGQLARILPSYFYINKACNAAQILIESTPYVRSTMTASRRNLINFAFWSCLQLESDIAAELELPLSGIGRFESPQHKEMPTSVTLEKIPESSHEDEILRFYSYQIQLRLTMNSIHATLYRASKDPWTRPSNTLMAALNQNLEDWRKMLDDWDWNDDDHESPDINVARMRGKYYGAKYIIWRPAVKYTLLQLEAAMNKEQAAESPAEHDQNSGATSPSMSNPSFPLPRFKTLPYIRPELLDASRICVQAAIRSTTVFDKVPRRLVVTNIFGTAHAQFGNMLVLYAVFTSPHPGLNTLVDEHTIKRLHDRTIDILRENEMISPILAKDLTILDHVRTRVFGPATSYPAASAASSFSSR